MVFGVALLAFFDDQPIAGDRRRPGARSCVRRIRKRLWRKRPHGIERRRAVVRPARGHGEMRPFRRHRQLSRQREDPGPEHLRVHQHRLDNAQERRRDRSLHLFLRRQRRALHRDQEQRIRHRYRELQAGRQLRDPVQGREERDQRIHQRLHLRLPNFAAAHGRPGPHGRGRHRPHRQLHRDQRADLEPVLLHRHVAEQDVRGHPRDPQRRHHREQEGGHPGERQDQITP